MIKFGRFFCGGLLAFMTAWAFSLDSVEAATVATPSSITVPPMDSDGKYSVSWGASATAGVSYELQEATDSGFTAGLRTITAGKVLSTVITGRTRGTIYYYRVRAKLTGYISSAWRTGQKGCKISLNPLVGRWIWQKDSDGTTPAAGAECSLVFFENGSADFHCFMPSQRYADSGGYSVAGATSSSAKLTLNLADYGVYLTSAPVTISSGTLTLPFMVISVDPGTSTWKKQPSPSIDTTDFFAVAFKVYEDSLLTGLSYDDAAIAAVKALRAGSFAADAPETRAQKSLIKGATVKLAEVRLTVPRTAIRVKKDNGRVYWILLKPKGPIDANEFKNHSAVNALTSGYYANDPRTQLYMTKSSGPNDPTDHSAVLLFPMDNQVTWMIKGDFYTFAQEGEDPSLLKDALIKAGYLDSNITVKTDGQVTPKTIANALLKNPGVFYISSHGVHLPADASGPEDFYVLTGKKVTVAPGQTLDQACSDAITALGLPSYLESTILPVAQRVDRFKEETFLGVGRAFFEALKANNPAWNMSKSLVYLDTCSSTTRATEAKNLNPTDSDIPLSRALFNNPAALIGWRKPSNTSVAVRYSQHFFENAARKTHSAREIWDETRYVLNTRYRIYEEDDRLDDPNTYERVALKDKYADYDAFGVTGKPYKHLGELYSDTQPDNVMWLTWLGRWNQAPDLASSNLRSCYDQFWANHSCGGLASPMCNSGCLGGHVPTANEVKEARQLINGQPTPVTRGRWTLADKIPYGPY